MSAKIKAGEAQVKASLTGSLKDGLRRQARHLARFGAQVAKIGAGIGAALGGAALASVASFANTGASLHKLSKQLGGTVEEISRLQFAARQLGIDPDDLTGAIEEVNIRIGETVRDGIGPAAEAFQQLGLDAGELARMPVAERIKAISQALAGIGSNTKRGFLADEIFGGDAFKILPLIREGAAGIAALTDEADRLGVTVTTSQAASAAELVGLWRNVKESIGGLITTIGSELTPVLLAIWDVSSPGLLKLKEFFENSGAEAFRKAVAGSASSFESVILAFGAVRKVFSQVKWGLNKLILVALQGFKQLVDGVNNTINAVLKKLDKIPGVSVTLISDDNAVSSFLGHMTDDLNHRLNKLQKEINAPIALPTFMDEFEGAVEERQQQAAKVDQEAKQAAEVQPGGPGMLEQYEALWKQVQEQGAAAAAGFGTRFAAVMDELNESAEMSSSGAFSAAAASQLGRAGDVDQKQLTAMLKMETSLAKIKEFMSQGGPLVWGA